jgi:hypothetical protein
VTDIDTTTGELLPARLSPDEVRARTAWIGDMLRAALIEKVDYDRLAGWSMPDLLKPGAEKLLLAARLGSVCTQIDDDDARDHRGVRYRCTVTDRAGFVMAVREGYAGYDESRFANHSGWRADWNNVCQMAQKRATVSATKAALAASGLFAEDGAPAPAPTAPRTARAGRANPRVAERVPDYVYDEAPEAAGRRVVSGSAGRSGEGPTAGPDPDGAPF